MHSHFQEPVRLGPHLKNPNNHTPPQAASTHWCQRKFAVHAKPETHKRIWHPKKGLTQLKCWQTPKEPRMILSSQLTSTHPQIHTHDTSPQTLHRTRNSITQGFCRSNIAAGTQRTPDNLFFDVPPGHQHYTQRMPPTTPTKKGTDKCIAAEKLQLKPYELYLLTSPATGKLNTQTLHKKQYTYVQQNDQKVPCQTHYLS